jgi:hypothetical protein
MSSAVAVAPLDGSTTTTRPSRSFTSNRPSGTAAMLIGDASPVATGSSASAGGSAAMGTVPGAVDPPADGSADAPTDGAAEPGPLVEAGWLDGGDAAGVGPADPSGGVPHAASSPAMSTASGVRRPNIGLIVSRSGYGCATP